MKWKLILLLTLFALVTQLVKAQGIRVGPGACLRVESGTTLDVTGGNLQLDSDGMGDASLIDHGNVTYSGSGQAVIQRYLTEGKWHLVSSPVNSALSGIFLNDYLQYHAEPTNGWTDIIPVDVPLNTMQGYALWSVEAGPATEVFSGISNSGSYSKGFSQTGSGWNLMGNPYPSAIDWDAVSVPAQLNGAVYLFDPTTGSNGIYRYYITGGGAGNTTSRYIPSGQGFFVRATGGPGTLSLNNSVRVHSGQDFYKSDENESMLVLEVSGNEITTKAAVRFNEYSTPGIDRQYDVFRIFSTSPEVPELFTRYADSELAVNTLPSIVGNEAVPLWFRCGAGGAYSIHASGLETFNSDVPVFLQDLGSGILTDLRKTPAYSFGAQPGTDKAFLVLFTNPASAEFPSNSVQIYAENKNLHVDFPVSCLSIPGFTATVMVSDPSGKSVGVFTVSGLRNTIPVTGTCNCYIVKVISGTDVVNKKVFIY